LRRGAAGLAAVLLESAAAAIVEWPCRLEAPLPAMNSKTLPLAENDPDPRRPGDAVCRRARRRRAVR